MQILNTIAVAYISLRIIFILGFVNIILSIIVPTIFVSDLMVACIAFAFLLENYMIHLIDKHGPTIEKELEKYERRD